MEAEARARVRKVVAEAEAAEAEAEARKRKAAAEAKAAEAEAECGCVAAACDIDLSARCAYFESHQPNDPGVGERAVDDRSVQDGGMPATPILLPPGGRRGYIRSVERRLLRWERTVVSGTRL